MDLCSKYLFLDRYRQYVEQIYNETGKKYDFQRYYRSHHMIISDPRAMDFEDEDSNDNSFYPDEEEVEESKDSIMKDSNDSDMSSEE